MLNIRPMPEKEIHELYFQKFLEYKRNQEKRATQMLEMAYMFKTSD